MKREFDQVLTDHLPFRLFEEMERSAQFEIRCAIKKTSTAQWPPALELLSVNGYATLKDYQLAMIKLYMQLVRKFMRALNQVDSDRRILWFAQVLKEGIAFIERQLPKVDLFKKQDLPDGRTADAYFFNSAICYIDNELINDPLMVLQALLKTNLHARAWHKMIISVSALLNCACCITLPKSHPGKVCSTPEAQGQAGNMHCPARFLESMVLAFEENEITLANECGEPPEQRISALRTTLLKRNLMEE